jgi:type I restriction enzyme S subunit
LRLTIKFGGWFSNAFCSTGFAVVRCAPDLADPGYIYAHLFGRLIGRQIDRIIAGSNYPAISSSDVRRLEVPLPRLEEQTAIATVLSDMDTEIEALERRCDKGRQLKQGMMQQLLTGRVRLVNG